MTNQNVRKTLGLAILIVAAGVFQSCKKSSDSTTTASGDWVQKSNFEGVARSNAVAFEINGKGFLVSVDGMKNRRFSVHNQIRSI